MPILSIKPIIAAASLQNLNIQKPQQKGFLCLKFKLLVKI